MSPVVTADEALVADEARRTDAPPMSVPTPKGTARRACKALSPPEEPPGLRPFIWGFSVMPGAKGFASVSAT